MTIFEHRHVGLVWYWIVTISDDLGRILVKVMDVNLAKAISIANEEFSKL